MWAETGNTSWSVLRSVGGRNSWKWSLAGSRGIYVAEPLENMLRFWHCSKAFFTVFLRSMPYRNLSRANSIKIPEGSKCILFFKALIGDLLASGVRALRSTLSRVQIVMLFKGRTLPPRWIAMQFCGINEHSERRATHLKTSKPWCCGKSWLRQRFKMVENRPQGLSPIANHGQATLHAMSWSFYRICLSIDLREQIIST